MLPPGSSIAVKVEGDATPILGDESIFQEVLATYVESLLERRGFICTGIGADANYTILLDYSTTERQQLQTSSTYLSHSSSATWAGAGSAGSAYQSPQSVGVRAASVIYASSALASATSVTTDTRTTTAFVHSLGLELRGGSGQLIWKGESLWESGGVSIESGGTTALQLLLSSLPRDKTIAPHVPILKQTHDSHYYRVYCSGRWFSCPGLPYRIAFEEIIVDKTYTTKSSTFSLPKSVKDREYLAAYLDLIRTAEIALPTGDDDWKDPLRSYLWSKVTLGGKYLIGPDARPVNVLVFLTGSSQGYTVEECKQASPAEFNAFESNLQAWNDTLTSYFDFYDSAPSLSEGD
jgi:hypothetical protein